MVAYTWPLRVFCQLYIIKLVAGSYKNELVMIQKELGSQWLLVEWAFKKLVDKI